MITVCERLAQVSRTAIARFTEVGTGFLYSVRVILLCGVCRLAFVINN
jgi:hypothetical protein